MFIIEQLDFDTKYYSKPHVVSTKEIADAVKNDLEQRFGPMTLKNRYGSYRWDPGGMIMAEDETFSFPLSSIVIQCKAQHFNRFVERLQKYKSRGDKVKYIKLHGYRSCVCIKVSEFEELKRLVNDPDLIATAEQSDAKRERKLNKLEDAGHVQRAIKGEDGKLYKAPRDTPNKKLLH